MSGGPSAAREARRYTVHGLVQGVAFRWFTKHAADRLGVDGWVRNRADGTVEAVAWGDAAAQAAFLEALSAGPPAARVDRVAVERAAGDVPRGFEIRR